MPAFTGWRAQEMRLAAVFSSYDTPLPGSRCTPPGSSARRLEPGAGKPKKQRKLKYCQIEGCGVDLRTEPLRNWQVKTCRAHQRADKVTVDGVDNRYCQQCVRFHPLDMFDGDKRGCRERLERHNRRRQLKNKQSSPVPAADAQPEQRQARSTRPLPANKMMHDMRDAQPPRLSELPLSADTKDMMKYFYQHGDVKERAGSKRPREPSSPEAFEVGGHGAFHEGKGKLQWRRPSMDATTVAGDYYLHADEHRSAGRRSPQSYWPPAFQGARPVLAKDSAPGLAGSSSFMEKRTSDTGDRRRTTSTRSGSDAIGELPWAESSRLWARPPFPPYPYPSEYAAWMEANEAMDVASMDRGMLWWRHMQESMRRYPAHESLPPYPHHYSALPGRMGHLAYGGAPLEDAPNSRRLKLEHPQATVGSPAARASPDAGPVRGGPGYSHYRMQD